MKTAREWMRDRRVAAGLALLAAVLVGYRLFPGDTARVPETTPPPEGIAREQGGDPAAAGQEPSRGSPEVRDAAPRGQADVAWSWGRNPFIPQWKEPGVGAAPGGGTGRVAGAAEEPPMGLRGTVISGRTGIAIFGNRLVSVGGKVAGWTVERVEPYRVELRSGHEMRAIELFKPPPSGGRGRGGER